jgi:GINS complex subunit 1
VSLPPKELFVEARVLQDAGQIVTESGATLILQEGTTHHMRRSDAEELIRNGVLEHVN